MTVKAHQLCPKRETAKSRIQGNLNAVLSSTAFDTVDERHRLPAVRDCLQAKYRATIGLETDSKGVWK